MALPGMRWQSDVGAAEESTVSVIAPEPFATVAQLEEANKHIRGVADAFRRDADLDTLLRGASREQTYQQHYQGVSTLI